MRRIASIVLLLVAAASAVVLTAGRSERAAAGFQFKVAFDDAFGLTEGGDLRVGGVKAGKTLKFEISKGRECQGKTPGDGPPRTCAIADAVVTENGFKAFKTDAHCDIRQQSLIGEYYVDCQPGHNKQALGNGAIIPDTQTTSTIPPDLVGDILRRPYRERLRLIIAELGTGLAGRPQDVAELLQRAHPGLRETSKVLKILGDQRTVIQNFITNSNTVVRQLDQHKADLARWLVTASRAADVSASRRTAIAAGIQRLPTFLDELNGTMARLENLTDAQTPLLHNLQDAAPSLNTFLTRLGPFTQASRPAIRSLGDTATIGKKAFNDSREEIATLGQLGADAPGAARPLRQLLQTMDDRNRSYENNPQAQASAPPAPDPTSLARSKGRGFTGLEAILNYTYWQTLALNEFDSIGHVLRAVALSDPQCSPFQNDLRTAALGGKNQDAARNRCNAFLGKFQPGITTPDTASPGGGTQAAGAAQKTSARHKRGRKGSGLAPGQRIYATPDQTLPPSQQQLLNTLSGRAPQLPSAGAAAGQAPSASPADPGSSVSQVLNYLLAP